MPKFKKGSPEAKAFMAKLRAMRGKKSGKTTGGSYNSAALDGFGKRCRGGSYNTAAMDGYGLPKKVLRLRGKGLFF